MSLKTIANALYLLRRAGVPVMLEGVHGVGKTSILYQLHARIREELKQSHDHQNKTTLEARDLAKFSVVDKNEYGLWAFSAANVSVEEIIGYPQVTDQKTLRYLRSNNFIPPADHLGGGILAPDELNLSDPPVERALMSLALEGRFLDYVLPPNVFIVTSQNPATGEYHSRRLNPPTLNRFCQIKVIVESKEVIEHFMERDFHPAIIDCISEHAQQVLNPHQDKIDFSIDQTPTSRSWDHVNNIMRVATAEEIGSLGLVVFSGLLGPSAGAIFQKFATDMGERSIPLDDVLNGYGYDEKKYDPNETGIKSWPMSKIRRKVKRVTNQASVRADIISVALTALVQKMKAIAEDVKKQTAEKGGNVIDAMTSDQKKNILNALAFLCDLPPDQSGPAFMRQLKNNGFEYTIKPLARHLICDDYHKHWDSVNTRMIKESNANVEA